MKKSTIIRSFADRWHADAGYRHVLSVAVPLILSTGAWTVQHFVDRMFLAWYSSESIAAALPAGILNFTIMSLFVGTAGYVSTFVAQYCGAGRLHRIGPALWQGIYMSLLGGVMLICLIPFAEPLFRLVGHDPAVQRQETLYFQILCLGGCPAIAAASLSGFFSGRGRTWPVMWVNTLATAANLVLDYGLIFGKWGLPEWGIKGAGIATVFSAVVSFLAYMVLISIGGHNRDFHTLRGWRPDRELFLRLLRFGFPSGVQFFIDMAGFTLFILLVGRLGTIQLAATNIALNISTLSFMPMIGLGIAVSVLVGQYLGANRSALAQKSTYSGFWVALVYMVAVAAAFVLFPDLFVRPFAARAQSDFRPVYGLAVILLRFVAAYSVFDTMNIIFASAIKGAGDTRFVMFMMGVITSLFLAVPAYLVIVVFKGGLMMSWVIATGYVIALGSAFYLRFLGGKWKHMRVIEKPLPSAQLES